MEATIPGNFNRRKKISVLIPWSPLMTRIDAEWEAMQAMKRAGAVDIRDFKEVNLTPKDKHKVGKKNHKKFEATAIPAEVTA